MIIDHSGIRYHVNVTDMPDEEGNMMFFSTDCVEFVDTSDYTDLRTEEQLYELILAKLVKGEG